MGFLTFLKGLFFNFATEREVIIRDKKIVILYRILQLLLLIYIIWFGIIYNKGYQTSDEPISSTTTKIKGTGVIGAKKLFDKYNRPLKFIQTNDFGYTFDDDVEDTRVFDTPEFAVPPNEYESVFIMTNFIKTSQKIGICDEPYTTPGAKCKSNSHCMQIQDQYSNIWHGAPTGNCVKSSMNKNMSVCEIYAWCPAESSVSNKEHIIFGTQNYTIFIRNNIEFEKFQRKESNVLPKMTNDYISSCINRKEGDKLCPVFSIYNILKEAEPNEKERAKMIEKGGVIQIEIIWDCNYDIFSPKCLPQYGFHRLDVPFSTSGSSNSGFNFRFANKYLTDGIEHRILYKAYGLRFIISVGGQAGKFSILRLTVNIGSGMGLLAIASMIADFFMLTFVKKKELYKNIKEVQYSKSQTKEPTMVVRL